MDNLKKLAALCKGSVMLEANPHRDNYESVAEYLARWEDPCPGEEGPTAEDLASISAGASFWRLQFYPETPVGFNVLFGADPDALARRALEML